MNIEKAKKVCCRLYNTVHAAWASYCYWCSSGEGEQHPVSGCAHHRGPLLVHQHCITSWEGSAALCTEAPSKATWPSASLCHAVISPCPAVLPTGPSLEQGERSLVPLSTLLGTYTAPTSSTKPSALQVIPLTFHIAISNCCPRGGDCSISVPGPAEWLPALLLVY